MKSIENQHGFWGFPAEQKKLHIIFWIIIIVINIMLYFDADVPLLATIIENSAVFLIAAIPFYFTSHHLVPKYLYRGRYFAFLVIVIVVALLMALTYMIIYYIYNYLYYYDTFFNQEYNFWAETIEEYFILFWTYIIPFVLGTGMKVMTDRINAASHLRKIKLDQVASELNYLKSQLHPHFLFNVLNTIYFQISKENTKARSLVEVTSEMLRYQLYDVGSIMASMDKEIEYLKQYIKILEIKDISSEKIMLHIDKMVFNYKIASSIIVPVIECGLKFVNDKANHITIDLRELDPCSIIYRVEIEGASDMNKHRAKETFAQLKNRLEILYPSKHKFEYKTEGNKLNGGFKS